jgi:hypothetical protein
MEVERKFQENVWCWWKLESTKLWYTRIRWHTTYQKQACTRVSELTIYNWGILLEGRVNKNHSSLQLHTLQDWKTPMTARRQKETKPYCFLGIQLNLFGKSTHNSEVPFFAQGIEVLQPPNQHKDLL